MNADLDERVGLENFPDVPVAEMLSVVIQAQVQSYQKAIDQLSKSLSALGWGFSKIRNQSDYTLWPPAFPESPKSDSPFKKKPAYINKPDFKGKESIAYMRSKQLSRPIGQPGCGIVWNRGRFTP